MKEYSPSLVILFNASPKEALRAAKAVAPWGFVMIFADRSVEEVHDFSDVDHTHIVRPIYIGNLSKKSQLRFVNQQCAQMMRLFNEAKTISLKATVLRCFAGMSDQTTQPCNKD